MGKLVGYARVSTNEQDLKLQLDALKEAGIDKHNIFLDKISGSKNNRPGLDDCLSSLRKGDSLIVWRLDRLGRSLSHLIEVVRNLANKGVTFKSLSEGIIDTSSATGEMVFHIFSVLSQFERRLIQERTKAGLDAARARGKMGGRPTLSSHDPKVTMAKKMYADKSIPISQICKSLEISKTTFYRYLGK